MTIGKLPKLIWITDASSRGTLQTIAAAKKLCELAVPNSVCVQLRDRELPVLDRLMLGEQLRKITHVHSQGLLVNDALYLALLLDADGVHLTESSVTTRDARRYFETRGRPCFLTRAIHKNGLDAQTSSLDPRASGAVRTLEDEPDAQLLAPIFASRKGMSPLGTEGLSAFRRFNSTTPVYALGGVSASECAACLGTGASGVAVISAGYDDPEALLGALRIGRIAVSFQ